MMTNPEKSRSQVLEVHEKRLAELEHCTRLQAAALDSMRAELKRQEDLVAWVVDLLDALQSNALDQPRGSEVAGTATPPR
jgi:uncharacterized coiled-coil protein SlyX